MCASGAEWGSGQRRVHGHHGASSARVRVYRVDARGAGGGDGVRGAGAGAVAGRGWAALGQAVRERRRRGRAGQAGLDARGGGPGTAVLGRREREGRKEGKERKRKKGEGKKEKKIEKERKWGKREERKEKGGGRCAPAATAGAVGHAWRAARGRWGTRPGRKERGKKEGRDSRRPVTTRRVGWERDGMWIEFGCRVVRERLWGLGFWV